MNAFQPVTFVRAFELEFEHELGQGRMKRRDEWWKYMKWVMFPKTEWWPCGWEIQRVSMVSEPAALDNDELNWTAGTFLIELMTLLAEQLVI